MTPTGMFTQPVEYALRALAHLACSGRVMSAEQIAGKMQVSRGYLSKVLRDLVQADLVRSFRGPNGGFLLARDAGNILISDVLRAMASGSRAGPLAAANSEYAELAGLRALTREAIESIDRCIRLTTLAVAIGAPKIDRRACPARSEPGLRQLD